MIAAVLKLPVSLAFGLYRGGNRYDLVFETFEDQGLDLPRAQRATRMAALIQRYAARLEHHARQAPYNWFNFYDFWNAHEQPQPAPRGLPTLLSMLILAAAATASAAPQAADPGRSE